MEHQQMRSQEAGVLHKPYRVWLGAGELIPSRKPSLLFSHDAQGSAAHPPAKPTAGLSGSVIKGRRGLWGPRRHESTRWTPNLRGIYSTELGAIPLKYASRIHPAHQTKNLGEPIAVTEAKVSSAAAAVTSKAPIAGRGGCHGGMTSPPHPGAVHVAYKKRILIMNRPPGAGGSARQVLDRHQGVPLAAKTPALWSCCFSRIGVLLSSFCCEGVNLVAP
ncbi:unnamed protein product [Pleuronectes platessa]|uniref:Uncharacterized protein n=1 Tax=Pleuronectes platessa TaxID=8262 RepID=A0A9N7YLT5_PLEPL|nr:unnamed protein product [Pleuronectes platessa]